MLHRSIHYGGHGIRCQCVTHLLILILLTPPIGRPSPQGSSAKVSTPAVSKPCDDDDLAKGTARQRRVVLAVVAADPLHSTENRWLKQLSSSYYVVHVKWNKLLNNGHG